MWAAARLDRAVAPGGAASVGRRLSVSWKQAAIAGPAFAVEEHDIVAVLAARTRGPVISAS